MIQVNDLSFAYPGHQALDQVSFRAEKGSVTAVVGPNGAGKTTLFRCLAALETPASGTVFIDGTDITEDPLTAVSKIGYLPDFFGLYDELTVRQTLQFAAGSQALPRNLIPEAVEKAAERVQITDRLEQKAGQLSRGLRQRLAIALSIIHEPPVLLLDEPASGLDPEARITLSRLLISLRDQGITLLVSSHILSELEDYSTHMIILKDGKIVSHDRFTASALNRSRLILQTAGRTKEAADFLKKTEDVTAVVRSGDLISFEYRSDPASQSSLLNSLITEGGLPVRFFSEDKTDMNQTYLKRITDSSKSRRKAGG